MSITNVIQINTNAVGVQQGGLNSIQISSSLEHSQDYLKSPQPVDKSKIEKVPQLVAQIFQIPWGHNREIITKCKSHEEALYYVNQTIAEKPAVRIA